MKIFYHCLIMWGPFVILFAIAGLGLEVLEGDIRRSENSLDIGYLGILFITGSLAFIFYIVSFLPLTFVVNKFVKPLLFKVVIFTFGGGVIGAFAFRGYDSRFIEKYNVSAIILFSIAGLLYSLIENSVKRNIKFI